MSKIKIPGNLLWEGTIPVHQAEGCHLEGGKFITVIDVLTDTLYSSKLSEPVGDLPFHEVIDFYYR